MARKIPAAAESPIPWQLALAVKDPGWVFPKLALLKTEFLTTCSQRVAEFPSVGMSEHQWRQIDHASAFTLTQLSHHTTVEPL